MMDVADHRAMFAAVRRVLAPGGLFVFTMLHPCFEGRPFHVTEAPPYLFDEAGLPEAYVVRRYATEGHWNSGGEGVRGRMGAYHRTLSTYVNDLIAAGFVLERLEEPRVGDPGVLQEPRRGGAGLSEREEVMLAADKVILERLHLLLRAVKDRAKLRADIELAGIPAHPGAFVEVLAEPRLERRHGDAELLKDGEGHAFLLRQEGEQEVLVGDLLVGMLACDILGALERLLHLLGKAVNSHAVNGNRTRSTGKPFKNFRSIGA